MCKVYVNESKTKLVKRTKANPTKNRAWYGDYVRTNKLKI